MDRNAWRATVHRITKSWTQLSTHAHTQLFNNTSCQNYINGEEKMLCLGNCCIAFTVWYVGGVSVLPILSAGEVPGFLIKVFKLFE